MSENNKDDIILKRQRSFIIKFVYWAIILACLFFLWKYLLPVLTPFVIAFIIAMILNRPISFVTTKLKINHKFTASIFVLLFILGFSFIAVLLVFAIFNGIQSVFAFLPSLFSDLIIPLLEEVIIKLDQTFKAYNIAIIDILSSNSATIIASINQAVNSISNTILSSLTSAIGSIPGFFMSTIITIIATFFVSMDYKNICDFFKRQIPTSKVKIFDEIKNYIFNIIPKFILSYGAIMCITFIELMIGFTILDVPYAILISMLIAILDILPVLGTGGVLIPWSIFSLVIGNFKYAIGIALLYLVITIIRNIVEPRLIGKQMGLHPVLTLASMLVGLRIFGFIGLFALPLLLSLIKKMNDDGLIHIFN